MNFSKVGTFPAFLFLMEVIKRIKNNLPDCRGRISQKIMEHNDQYFAKIAAAYVRGKLSGEELLLEKPLEDLSPEEVEGIFHYGKEHELKLYPFKRTRGLPRVLVLLGLFSSIRPSSLLDIGTGRGVFLYPFLDKFPKTKVECIDKKEVHVDDLLALKNGGYDLLNARNHDVRELPYENNSFQVVTALEVLEHIDDLESAFQEITRVASDWIICSMPSKEDDNEEHINLFTKESVTAHFNNCGIHNIKISYTHEHMLVIAKKS